MMGRKSRGTYIVFSMLHMKAISHNKKNDVNLMGEENVCVALISQISSSCMCLTRFTLDSVQSRRSLCNLLAKISERLFQRAVGLFATLQRLLC